MEGDRVSTLLRILVLASALVGSACATTEIAESLRGEVVDSRSGLGYAGQPRYFLTIECRENPGVLSRMTFEVNQEEWMRFHSTGEEVCLIPHMGTFRLSHCR